MNWKGIPITDGSGQLDRALDALGADYFNVDELDFENLLAMGAEFASVIKYHNLSNHHAGDWGDMFNADEAVVMAGIVSMDLKRTESDFRAIPFSDISGLLNNLLDLAGKIDFWLRHLTASQHESGKLLEYKIRNLIKDKLAVELRNLYQIARLAEIPQVSVEEAEFGLWNLADIDESIALNRQPITVLPENDKIKKLLSSSFYVFLHSISHLKTSAASCLQKSLDSGHHLPAIGLFIVFVKLYQKAQRQLNRFTLRHLDFYYRQVLEVSNRERLRQSYYLLLENQIGSDRVQIEKGTEFSAGKDAELNDIIYAAGEDLSVSDVRIASLASLYMQHDPLVSPESELGFVTRIKSSNLPLNVDADNAAYGPIPWPLFGAETGAGEKTGASDARIGFCVASTLLYLEQGLRSIDLTIEFDPAQRSRLEGRIAKLLEWEKDNEGLTYTLIRNMFDIKLTTESGWLEVRDYYFQLVSRELGGTETGIRISIVLNQDLASITAYNPEVHGGGLQTDLPVLQCLLNPSSNFCGYSLFEDLVVASLRIDVDVSGIRNLQVHNQHGQLDSSKPFQPFGPLPSNSSYLIFGGYELARKHLQQIEICLDWAELPLEGGGFESYYTGYGTAYRNDSFQVNFSTLADSRWQPEIETMKPRFSLFETPAREHRVASRTRLLVNNLEYSRPIDAGLPEAEYRYELKTRKGFYRLSLAAPDSAFGHREYGQLITETLSANARLKKNLKPMPNPAYTPTLKGLSLAYKASITILPSSASEVTRRQSDRLFHIHPFGTETLFPARQDRPCYLLPQYGHEGNLFIGLTGKSISGSLSLLFHLSKDLDHSTQIAPDPSDWFYLVDNNWEKIPENKILANNTLGFLATGKVTLNIPPDISKDNSVMPGNLYWLRVSVKQRAGIFPSCYTIQPHVLKISRKSPDPEQPTDTEHTTTRAWTSINALPGIGGIRQAHQAFGGRPAESDDELKVRVSERLRHKNRALMPWDYEQLVLEHFPEIFKVKCFNSISSIEDKPKPGQALIVVVPRVNPVEGRSCAHEMVNVRELSRIKRLLQDACSPFVTLEVRNPQYEQVQVRCTVKFKDAANMGASLNRLNQEISDYICPWKSGGYPARFGWSIRQQDIESHISGRDYVEAVTNFSMLHITVDRHGKYRLGDTVRDSLQNDAVIRPRYPWSLAVPVENHFIETMPSAVIEAAKITGIKELAVGSTFIIVGSSENGEKE